MWIYWEYKNAKVICNRYQNIRKWQKWRYDGNIRIFQSHLRHISPYSNGKDCGCENVENLKSCIKKCLALKVISLYFLSSMNWVLNIQVRVLIPEYCVDGQICHGWTKGHQYKSNFDLCNSVMPHMGNATHGKCHTWDCLKVGFWFSCKDSLSR